MSKSLGVQRTAKTGAIGKKSQAAASKITVTPQFTRQLRSRIDDDDDLLSELQLELEFEELEREVERDLRKTYKRSPAKGGGGGGGVMAKLKARARVDDLADTLSGMSVRHPAQSPAPALRDVSFSGTALAVRAKIDELVRVIDSQPSVIRTDSGYMLEATCADRSFVLDEADTDVTPQQVKTALLKARDEVIGRNTNMTTATASSPGMPSLRLEDNPDLGYLIGLTLAKAQNSTPVDRATKRRTRENEISIARIFANEQIVLTNDVLGMIGQREDSPTVCKLLRILNLLRTVVDVANLAVKSERLARMTEEDIIVEQNIAIFHIYRYLYDINLLRKNTRIKAADEWTTMTADCDPKDEGLEDRRQAYVRNLKKSADKLSRKWKQQIRQMRVKAFHEKIVLVSKQLPRTAPSLAPPPAKRPRIEVAQEQTELP